MWKRRVSVKIENEKEKEKKIYCKLTTEEKRKKEGKEIRHTENRTLEWIFAIVIFCLVLCRSVHFISVLFH